MRFLYVFPHPDDESFGPVGAMHRQLTAGHEVFLYTLTHGEATSVRHELGINKEKMGQIRWQEMRKVEQTVGLTGMKVDTFPDNQLAELDPRILERAVRAEIERLQPDIVVSYPVHGVSALHDHLVMHAVIKRVYLELREEGADYLRRLAFITLPDKGGSAFNKGNIRFKQSPQERIDCVMEVSDEEYAMLEAALGCYDTYQGKIRDSGVLEKVRDKLYFEFFQENFDPPLGEIHARLPG